MTTDQVLLKGPQKVKVIFGERDQRYPMIGRFVYLNDSQYLLDKGMVRFVNQSKLDFWNDAQPNVGLTKIYKTSDFTQLIAV